MKKKILLLFILVGAVFIFAIPAHALIISHYLNFEYSNGAPPAGSSPWLTATFNDEDQMLTDGQVMLTMDTSGLTGTEFVTTWMFNIDISDPEFDDLEIDYYSGTLPASHGSGPNAYDITSARGFDIGFFFPNPNAQPEDRFGANEESVWLIYGIDALTADSFSIFNSPDNGDSPLFTTVAHVQGIVSDLGDSGKIGDNPNANPVPEPSTLLLVGFGLIGLARFGRRRFKT